MIFVGDIAHPFEGAPPWNQDRWPWAAQAVVGNLEGALTENVGPLIGQRLLFNHMSVLGALVSNGFRAVSLANNHITDMPGGVPSTRELLLRKGILPTGAGLTLEEASQPAILEEDGRRYILLAFGWETIQCARARPGSSGVNPLRPANVLRLVERWRAASGDAAIVALVHWNYELERYPQPAHRQLAMAAIDAGASAVIGHHPHCVSGLEFYGGGLIAYSLGNWWMPHHVFFGGRLAYPHETCVQLALEWRPGNQPVLHWFEYSPRDHRLTHVCTEPASSSERLQALTPFANMSHEAYRKWFRANRVKRRALPIYLDYRARAMNLLKDTYVHVRQIGVTAASRSGLRRRFGL